MAGFQDSMDAGAVAPEQLSLNLAYPSGAGVTGLAGDNPIPTGTMKPGSERADEDDLEAVFQEAKKRFAMCNAVEGDAQKHFLEDYKFAEADSDNGYQWPNRLFQQRDIAGKPCLTINETRQHNLQIINDAKQNKPGIKIRPTGGGASAASAKIWQDIVRHIEYISSAQRAYDKATEFQVKGGWGYIRLVTDYAGPDTFDQEIYIIPVKDPTSIFLDPHAQQPDKSDANFGFVFRDLDKDTFDSLYPEYVNEASSSPLGEDSIFWASSSHVRVVEYYRRVNEPDTLIAYIDPNDQQRHYARKSVIGEELAAKLLTLPGSQSRETFNTKVYWYLIIGNKVRDMTEWPGKYIPIIMVIGEETVIEGQLDRKGHTRALKDPQRMYNYWTSAATEQVALQGKSPWLAPVENIEELGEYWNTANINNFAVLPYRTLDDNGQPLPGKPERVSGAQMAEAYITGMQVTRQELVMVSGQDTNAMGQQGNERTGAAINARQRQGNNATYHYIDNLAMAITLVGKQILDLVPKVYDTERVLRITADDGEDYDLTVNPNAAQPFQQQQDPKGKAIASIFNPRMGTYEVIADVGPDYATKREEAWSAYSLILTQNPQLVNIIGDLLFRAADFPHAEEAAKRLKNMVPAEATGAGPSAEVTALKQQIQNTQNALAAALNEIAKKQGKLEDKDLMRDVDIYKAETARLEAIGKLTTMSPEELAKLAKQLAKTMQRTDADIAEDLSEDGETAVPSRPLIVAPGAEGAGGPGVHTMGNAPGIPGAKMTSDGHWNIGMGNALMGAGTPPAAG